MTEPDSVLHTRPSLLMRIRDPRDDEAWSIFYRTYGPVVYFYCRRRGLQDGDACDVAQQVMVQVAQAAPRFEYARERGRFRDWLGTVTRNKLTDHLRAAGQRTAGSLDEDIAAGPGVDADWSEEFDGQVYRTALERVRPHFEPATWRAFEATWVENRSAAEAARLLGVPIESVYLAKSRILKRLREEVIALAEDLPLYMPLG